MMDMRSWVKIAYDDFCENHCFMNQYNPKSDPLWRKAHDQCTNCSAEEFFAYLETGLEEDDEYEEEGGE